MTEDIPQQWLTKTEHQEAWWGTQPCQECNPLGLPERAEGLPLPRCPNPQCKGTGWTIWASLATTPWSEIVPGIWVGGHDFTYYGEGGLVAGVSAYPGDLFNLVLSAYSRPGQEPSDGVEHIEVYFEDSHLTEASLALAEQAAQLVVASYSPDGRILIRCQAGLNRSSLIAGLALVSMGYEGADVVQLIRTRRSPWALCNTEYANHLSGLSAGATMLPANSEAKERESDTDAERVVGAGT